MKKSKKSIGIILLGMLILMNIGAIQIGSSYQIIKNDPDLSLGDNSVYVGEMEIIGNGEYNTAYIVANAEENKIVKVDTEGSTITFIANYYMYCGGLFDGGQVELQVDGADSKVETTTHEKEGTLYTYLQDCKPGDILVWTLITAYDDIFFDEPIVVYDYGTGLCTPKSRNIEAQSLFERIQNKFTNILTDIFQLKGYLLSRLTGNIREIKGTIICK